MGAHLGSNRPHLLSNLGAHRWRVRIPASGLVVGLVVAITGALLPQTPAGAISIPSGYFVVTDQAGANDVPAQSDLTQMGRDDSSLTLYKLFWSWDSTDQWAGAGQTGDACALFDYNGNGNIDAVVCGQIHNPNGSTATVVENHAPYVFRCDDSKSDRCSQPSAPLTPAAGDVVSGSLVGMNPSPPANLITDTDPFNAAAPNGPGSNYPNDSTLAVNISKAYLASLAANLGAKYPAIPNATPTLVNVCSYPSAGNGGNNNPFDCIVNPGGGFLVVTKNASPVDGTFNFSTPAGTKQLTTVGGSASTAPISLAIASAAGSTYSVSETVPSTWDLTGASCKVEGTGPDVGSFTNPTVSSIPILSGLRTICVFTDVKQQPSIGVVKYVSVDGGTTWLDANTSPGPTLLSGHNPQYKFVITNTGNVTLTSVSLSDVPALTLTGCTLPTTLAAGASVTCYATGTWAAGAQTDTATASGTFGGTPYTASDSAHYFGATATIDVKKEVSVDGGSTWADANSPTGPFLTSGTDPQFRFTLKNTGNVTLSSISLTDSDFSLAGCNPAIPSTLAPNVTYTCTLTEPWAAGQHTDTATGSGSYTDSGGNTATPSDTDDANYFGGSPTIEAKKYVSVDGGTTWLDAETGPGPSLLSGHDPQFKFVVHNAGNVTLSSVLVSDTDYSLTSCNFPTTLNAGATVTCILTEPWAAGLQADTLSASGSFGGTPYSASDEAHYQGITATVTVTKEVSVDGGTTWQDADTATGPTLLSGTDPQFRFTLHNTGTADLTSVSLTDSDFSLAGCSPAVPATLAAGAQVSCVLTEPWATGQHTDTATGGGTATDSGGNTATPSDTDDANYFGASPAVSVVKYVSADGGATWVDADTAPGPQVPQGTDPQYKFVVTNSGNVDVSVDLSDAPALTLTGAGCTLPKTLAPGASVECFATDTWASGQQHDVATATGSYTDSAGHTASPSSTNPAYYFGAAPGIALTKSASPTTYSGSGQTITYTYVVSNTGNTTLSAPILVADDHIGNPLNTPITCSNSDLAPGASVTCGATYVTTQADVAAGKVTNTAVASSGRLTSQPAKATVTYVPPAVPAIALQKTATPVTYKAVGEVITYTYVITNVGNVALAGPFTVADNKATVTCPSVASLAIGATLTCTATYTITQADLDAGSVTNIATASGGGVTSAPATATVNAVADPKFSLAKSSVPPTGSVVQPGQRIDYAVTYTNVGNVTLADTTITDHVPDGTTYIDGSAAPAGAVYDAATNTVSLHTGAVAPGQAVTVSFAVTVNMDLPGGTDIVNLATVGTQPSNETRHPVASGDLTVSKTVDKASAEFGDTLTYTVTVAATGTLDQTNVVASDVVPDGTTYVEGSATCASPCTASYDAATRTVSWMVGDVAAGTSVSGLVFKVTIDLVTPNPDGSIPSRVITNVAQVMSDQSPIEPSEPVTTIVTAVLGEQQERPPETPLPFTGAPIQQLVSLAAIMLVVGAALTARRRRTD